MKNFIRVLNVIINLNNINQLYIETKQNPTIDDKTQKILYYPIILRIIYTNNTSMILNLDLSDKETKFHLIYLIEKTLDCTISNAENILKEMLNKPKQLKLDN